MEDEKKLTEAELVAGLLFTIEADDEDPRWEWVHIRQPRMPEGNSVATSGEDAQWQAMRYALVSTSGILAMLAGSLPIQVAETLSVSIGAQIVMGITEAVVRFDALRRESPREQ